MKKMESSKVGYIAVLGFVALVAFGRVYANEKIVRVDIDLDDKTVTLDCSESGASQIEDRYLACKDIFKNEGEQVIAQQYCLPLAIAQACTDKPVASNLN